MRWLAQICCYGVAIEGRSKGTLECSVSLNNSNWIKPTLFIVVLATTDPYLLSCGPFKAARGKS